MAKIIYIDVETTGLDEEICGIYQLSGFIEIDGELLDDFDFMINPGNVYVEDFILQNLDSNGLTLEDLLSFEDSSKVFSEFLKIINKYINRFDKKDKFHLCGYNVSFDDRFLRKWFQSNNNKFYGSYFFSSKLDVFYLASYVLVDIRHKIPDFRLETLCSLFNIDPGGHDAKRDIVATYQLYQGLKNYLKVDKFI